MNAPAAKTYPPLHEGDPAPSFTAKFDSESAPKMQQILQGKKMVIYFYPKDDTPGCTVEAKDFRDHMWEFEAANMAVIGVSRDDTVSHDAFKKKYCLPFPLATDDTGSMCGQYGVWVEKSMYGKSYMGIERATFLITIDGTISRIWRKVKVDGHVKEVLEAAKKL